MLTQQVMSTTLLFIHCQTEVNISNMLSFTTSEFFFYGFVIIKFCLSRRQRKMYCGHARLCLCVCLSVCLSTAVFPHYCMDPDVTWGSGRGCPIVHYWADLQSVHGLHFYGNITRTLVTSLRPSHDMTT